MLVLVLVLVVVLVPVAWARLATLQVVVLARGARQVVPPEPKLFAVARRADPAAGVSVEPLEQEDFVVELGSVDQAVAVGEAAGLQCCGYYPRGGVRFRAALALQQGFWAAGQ